MTFGLPSWLKSRYKDLNYEVPVWYPSHDQPDHREWLVANGLGGYAAGSVSGAHTRRYHGCLVAAVAPPMERHIVLSRVEELVTLDGVDYELSTNHWASGVVAPTGYKLVESFTTLPSPTWVYNLDGHYLIKQMVMSWGANQVHFAYFWLPDLDDKPDNATITVRLLTAFRNFHDEVRGSADKRYVQNIFGTRSSISLNGSGRRLELSWSRGHYEAQGEWWWGYHWPEEASRGLPDVEDLYLVGTLTSDLDISQELCLCAGLDDPPDHQDTKHVVEANLRRQNELIKTAALPRSQENNLLILACDQFLVKRKAGEADGLSVIAGYPWFPDSGRDAMIAAPGLTLSVRRFDEARSLLSTFAALTEDGLTPHRFSDRPGEPPSAAADTTLWWAWSLYQYFHTTEDIEFVRRMYPFLKDAARQFVHGTRYGVKIDPQDGLLIAQDGLTELTWMDARVADISITPRAGKAVEICALWYNFLSTLRFFAEKLGDDLGSLLNLSNMCHASMQKFWNNESQCLYDVLEPGGRAGERPDDSMRPNQILAVSLPFRALTKLQEKAILTAMDRELLTPVGLRSLSPTDQSYQGRYGCGFARADQYHRDLSYHQGTVWPWLIGPYCDALMNVHGPLPEAHHKLRLLLQPLINHMKEEGCLGSIAEIFDGGSPHTPRGCFAQAWSVAETMRILATVLRAG